MLTTSRPNVTLGSKTYRKSPVSSGYLKAWASIFAARPDFATATTGFPHLIASYTCLMVLGPPPIAMQTTVTSPVSRCTPTF